MIHTPWADWPQTISAIQRVLERQKAPTFIHADPESPPFAVVLSIPDYNELLGTATMTDVHVMNHGHEDGDDW